ncbi:ABC transporter ATP-binding protein [Azospirillum oleiclasticum]|uniref:ABC transporter ATP-binding protein n=1 Tax=Azospirillum oleiclasticum TaxID=2735135 RepID=UPI0031B57B1A
MTVPVPTPVLEARGLSRVLPGPVPVTLVNGVDVAVAPGEFVAITGPSGSGKSSLLYLLGLLDRPTSGTVLLEGRDTAPLDGDELARLRLEKLGFVFQFHFLLPEFTVLDNVLVPMRKRAALPRAAMTEHALDLLDRLGLADQARKRPDQLSGGQRQRAAIARALANAPRVLLADEPTGNLDTRNAQTVFDIFRSLAADTGTAVVTVTHDEHLAAQTDRRLHLVDGRCV